MKALSREDILKADDLITEKVEVPEWGGEVYVRTMTALERETFENVATDERGDVTFDGFMVRLVVKTTVNGTGEPLFTEDDVENLKAKSGMAIVRIFRVATRLNGMRRQDIEDMIENLSEAPPGGSSSD
ncbi:MAG: hypothetical protein RX318_03925 [bacterium]|nr:hypothetical protein [bacterium]